ncbi:hypothetical protein HK405_015544, partial [Cladochytrium tenue]
PSSNVLLESNTDAVFDMVYSGSTVGTVTIPDLAISPGSNVFTATGYVYPNASDSAAVAATRDMLSKFTGGTTVQVGVTNGRSSNMPPLDAAFGAVSLTQSLPPNTTPLIVNSTFTFPNIFTFKSKVGLTAQNPFASPVSITHVTSTLTYKNEQIGTVDQAVSGFTIPANSVATVSGLTLKVTLDLSSIELLLLEIIGQTVDVDITSSLTINFGGYSTIIDYNQSSVPTKLTL